MILGIISDIHGHYDGLTQVLDELASLKAKVICLGDLVSEDSEDNDRCIQLIAEQGIPCVRGQHDDTCAKVGSPPVLPNSQKFLAELPVILTLEDIFLVHDNPLERARRGNGMWYRGPYIFSMEEASVVFEEFEGFGTGLKYVLVGHTHVPKLFSPDGEHDFEWSRPYLLEEGPCIINPGKIGGAHRGPAREVSYAVLDTSTREVTFFRSAI